VSDSGSRVLIAEDAAQLAKAREKRGELPDLTHVVLIDPAGADPSEDWVLTLEELERRGAARLEKDPCLIENRVGALTRDQLATLIYTSGTTGRP
ncbi:AMP-binding protein, partial [Streptomyces sp. TRM76130]|nr:AMP-binding protein [Streptomyces sp. TRM76130]